MRAWDATGHYDLNGDGISDVFVVAEVEPERLDPQESPVGTVVEVQSVARLDGVGIALDDDLRERVEAAVFRRWQRACAAEDVTR